MGLGCPLNSPMRKIAICGTKATSFWTTNREKYKLEKWINLLDDPSLAACKSGRTHGLGSCQCFPAVGSLVLAHRFSHGVGDSLKPKVGEPREDFSRARVPPIG